MISSWQEENFNFQTKDEAILAAVSFFEKESEDCLSHLVPEYLEHATEELLECFFEMLFELGANVNASSPYSKQTALHRCRRFDIARILIEHGADVNAVDSDGKTPLHVASDASTALLLILHGADVNARDNYGNTPLHYSKSGSDILIMHGADVNARNNYGETPLHWASDGNITELLIENGADINALNNDGVPPIHTTIDNVDVTIVLLNYGADVNAIDPKTGLSVLARYLRCAHRRIAPYFESLINLMICNGLNVHYTTPEHRNYIQQIETMTSCMENNYCPTITLINKFSSMGVPLNQENIMDLDLNKYDYINRSIRDKVVIRKNERSTGCYPATEYHLYIEDTMVGFWRTEPMSEDLKNDDDNYFNRKRFLDQYYYSDISYYNHYFGVDRYINQIELKEEYEAIQKKIINMIKLPACYIEYIYLEKSWRGKGLFRMMTDLVISDQRDYQHFYLRAEASDRGMPNPQKTLLSKYQRIGFKIMDDYGDCAVMEYHKG